MLSDQLLTKGMIPLYHLTWMTKFNYRCKIIISINSRTAPASLENCIYLVCSYHGYQDTQVVVISQKLVSESVSAEELGPANQTQSVSQEREGDKTQNPTQN